VGERRTVRHGFYSFNVERYVRFYASYVSPILSIYGKTMNVKS